MKMVDNLVFVFTCIGPKQARINNFGAVSENQGFGAIF
jgi:hypothetical protein